MIVVDCCSQIDIERCIKFVKKRYPNAHSIYIKLFPLEARVYANAGDLYPKYLLDIAEFDINN